MNALLTKHMEFAGRRHPGEHASARIIIPALVFFLAGAALSAVWFSRGGWHHSDAENPAALSDATKAVLQHLDSPVEIRFYSMLDASSVPESVRVFAGRVDQLLAQYEQAGGDRVRVVRCKSFSNSSANAAEADGIKAFNNDKGDACFLGIAVVCGGQKESLPQLAPEWEQALEPDVTRAIARAVEARPGTQPLARTDTATLDSVRKAIPNLEAVSLEEGTKVLRDASLAQFKQAAEEMQAQVKDAEQRFIRAQGDQSEAAQQAAAEQLQKIQAEGTRKLQQIAQDAHAQIAALQQLKKTAP
jgi:vacuolar-type H+-ATPase subunit H